MHISAAKCHLKEVGPIESLLILQHVTCFGHLFFFKTPFVMKIPQCVALSQCEVRLTGCMNLGTHVVTSSFKPASLNAKTASHSQFQIVWMSSIGNPLAYQLHLFGRICASQNVTQIGRNVFPLLDAVSHCKAKYSVHFILYDIRR